MKNIIIFLIFFFLFTTKLYAADKNLAGLQKELDEVTKQFESLEPSNLEEAVVFDNSIKEINKAVEFVQQSLENENPDIALKAVTFVKKSLSDISAILPKNYDSDMSNADMTSLGEETLKEVTNVTEGLAKKKIADTAKLITTMLDVNDAGFNVFDISKNLNSFGVETIKLQLDVKTREEMSQWTKEEWEAAWTGDVLTDDGAQIITDKEAQQRLDALNAQLGLVDEKNKIIEEKNNLRQETQKELNVLRDQLNDLNKEKTNILNPILANQSDIEEQIKAKQKEIDGVNSLITQYNADIVNIDKQIGNIQSQTSKIDGINSEIKTLTVNGDTFNKQTNELKNEILENNTRIAQLERSFGGVMAVARNKKTEFYSWHNNTITYEGRRVFDATLSKISNEQNISIELANLTDGQRIEYYNQYQSTFDAVKTWPNQTIKRWQPENLTADGTASGWIERQKKVLDLEREYLAWDDRVPQFREEINTKITENNKINLELTGLQDQIQYNENLVNIKKTELSATEMNIQKINLDDPRRAKLDSLQSEKINTLTKVDGKIQNFNQEIELNQNKINSNLSDINSFQSAEIELNQKLDYLNRKLESATLQKDFATVKSKENMKKEVEAFNNFGHILVTSYGEDMADVEVEFALKQADIILSGDSKKHQIFDFERYGTIAGLSKGVINKGKAAINNNDWNTQKEVYSQLYKSLSTNKNYNVDVLSAAELNVMVAEQKLENEIVDLIKSNPTNINFNPDVSSVYWPKGAMQPASLTEAVNSAYDQILEEAGLGGKIQEAEKATNAYKEYMYRDWKALNYKGYDLTKALNLQRESITLNTAVSSLQIKATQQARDIAWEQNNKIREVHVNAVNELNKMIDDKLATLPQYSEEKINTVKAIVSGLSPDSSYLAIDPSSDKIAAEAKAALYDDDGTMLKAYHIANDTRIKSFTYDTQGVGTIRSLANYKSDRTNVELAAEIQSTLEGTYDSDNINGYMAAKYGQGTTIEEIPRFTSKEKKEASKELSKIFSENISSTSTVKKEIKSIKNEIKSIGSEKIDITKNIQGLNEEIEKINSSEQKLQNQIAQLNLDLRQKEELFKDKEKAITNNINEVSAIDFQIEQLQSQKTEVESKINLKVGEVEERLVALAKTEGDAKLIANEFLAKQTEFDVQIEQLQESRKPLLNVTTSLDNELRKLDNELNELEKAKPIYEKQIIKLEDEIEKLKNTKADLATAQAQNIGLEVDEKTIKSIPIMEDTAIIALNGPALVRVVDNTMLVEQAEAFKSSISKFSVNTQIYTVDAVRPELFFTQELTNKVVTLNYEQAKAEREKAVENLNALEATPGASKAEIQSAKAARKAAKYAEIAAGQSVVTNRKIASAASAVTQEANLETLKAIASTPGMNKWNVRRSLAAVKAAEAEIAGKNYDYQGAVNKIANDEKKWNVWRLELYNKDLNALKATPGVTDVTEHKRQIQLIETRIERFKQQRLDERNAVESLKTKTNYFEILNKVVAKNAATISSTSFQETAKVVAEGTKEVAEVQEASTAAQEATLETLRKVASTKKDRWERAEANAAVRAAETAAYGATLQNTYSDIKYAREKAVEHLKQLKATPGASKAAIQAAESARDALSQAKSAAVDKAIQEATAAVQAATADVQEAAKEVAQVATQAAQKAGLEALKAIASTGGMSQWDVHRALAAVKSAEAGIAGTEYDLEHALNTINKNKAYEEAGGEPNRSGRTWDGH